MSGLKMKYFTLNPAKNDAYGEASREAMKAYAVSIYPHNQDLSRDLDEWVRNTSINVEKPNNNYEEIKLSTIINLWDYLHVMETGDIGFTELTKGLEQCGVRIINDRLAQPLAKEVINRPDNRK